MQATARRLSVVSATSCARRRLIRDVRQKYKTIMEYVALTFAIIAFPLAIGAYYRIDKLEKELKAKNLIANDFDSNK